MRKSKFQLLLVAAILFIVSGCQQQVSTVSGTSSKHTQLQLESALELNQMRSLLQHDVFIQINIESVKGGQKIVFDQMEELASLQQIIRDAVKEPGIVNMASPEYKLTVIYKGNKEEYLNVWIGEVGQKSVFMNTKNTETIYTVSEEQTEELIEIIEKRMN